MAAVKISEKKTLKIGSLIYYFDGGQWYIKKKVSNTIPIFINLLKKYFGLEESLIRIMKKNNRIYMLILTEDPRKFPVITLKNYIDFGHKVSPNMLEKIRANIAFKYLISADDYRNSSFLLFSDEEHKARPFCFDQPKETKKGDIFKWLETVPKKNFNLLMKEFLITKSESEWLDIIETILEEFSEIEEIDEEIINFASAVRHTIIQCYNLELEP